MSDGAGFRSDAGITFPSGLKNGAAKYCGHSPGVFVMGAGAYCARYARLSLPEVFAPLLWKTREEKTAIDPAGPFFL